jgi:hypothetical protein
VLIDRVDQRKGRSLPGAAPGFCHADAERPPEQLVVAPAFAIQ